MKVATERRHAAEAREKNANALTAKRPDVADMFDRLAAEHERNAELYAAGPEDLGWTPQEDDTEDKPMTAGQVAVFMAFVPEVEALRDRIKRRKFRTLGSRVVDRKRSRIVRPAARARESRPSGTRVAIAAASSSRGDRGDPSSSSDDDSGPERAPHRNGEARLDLDPHRGLEPLRTVIPRADAHLGRVFR